MSTFHCTRCGRAIFRREDLIETVTLWDLGEYHARCHVIRRLHDEPRLVRYDVSLHQGWYCCRFIAMRMVVDKFGTGDQLLVYEDSVVEVADGQAAPTRADHKGQVKLTARDFDAVIAAPEHRDELLWIKFGAIWCPPCRLMDSVISRLVEEGTVRDVRFFEVDVDEEQTLGRRWSTQSIPFSVLFFNGRQLEVRGTPRMVAGGGIVGGLRSADVVTVASRALHAGRSGARTVQL